MARMFSSGEGYEGMMGRHSRKLAPLFADFAQVRDAGSLLDMGCGTGSLTQVLADRTRAAKVVGVDPSSGFVDFARDRFSSNKRVSVDQGSAVELPYPDRSFDQAVSLLVLMFIPDVDKAVREMRRVTKAGGTVAACVWDNVGMRMGSIMREEATKLDPAAAAKGERIAQHFGVGDLSALWRKNGMESIVEAPLEIRMEFSSFYEYWTAMLAGGGPNTAYLEELPGEQKERLRLALKKRHLGDRPDGPYSLPAKALAVRGVVPG